MTLVAPVNLTYNIKTLWFDPKGLNLKADDKVVVKTARGLEMGVMASDLINVSDEQIEALPSKLLPILRIATEEDLLQADKMRQLSQEAMPIFKKLALEQKDEMHPVSVEYMLDGDKAVFYFESEKRVDFRELVRKLAGTFHVRIDMRQIGVRDEARIVGGLAHCGQVVCCKRLGGEFKPVSIKMAKDQNLSLNSQKISGLCGRLMCCLRYEDETYKEFKAKAPKVDAEVKTPTGEGRVVEYDVVKELIYVKVGDDLPVAVPLSAFTDISENQKHCVVDAQQWQDALDEADSAVLGVVKLLDLPSFSGQDKLGGNKVVHNERSNKKQSDLYSRKPKSSKSSQSGKRDDNLAANKTNISDNRKARRRSTKISTESGQKQTIEKGDSQSSSKKANKLRPGHKSSGLSQLSENGNSNNKRNRRKRTNSSNSN